MRERELFLSLSLSTRCVYSACQRTPSQYTRVLRERERDMRERERDTLRVLCVSEYTITVHAVRTYMEKKGPCIKIEHIIMRKRALCHRRQACVICRRQACVSRQGTCVPLQIEVWYSPHYFSPTLMVRGRCASPPRAPSFSGEGAETAVRFSQKSALW